MRVVIAASIARGSIVSRSGSMIGKDRRRARHLIASAEYAADSGVVITVAARLCRALEAQRERVGAGATPTANETHRHRGELRLERRELGTEDEPPSLDDAIDRRAHGRRVRAGPSDMNGIWGALLMPVQCATGGTSRARTYAAANRSATRAQPNSRSMRARAASPSALRAAG